MKMTPKFITLILCMLLCSAKNGFGETQRNNSITSASISIHIDDVVPTDTLTLYYWADITNEQKRYFTTYTEFRSVKNEDGTFIFEIPDVQSFGYFDVSKGISGFGVTPFLQLYIVEPGDSVQMNIRRNMSNYEETHNKYNEVKYLIDLHKSATDGLYEVDFSGNGSLKYNLRFTMDKLSYPPYSRHKYLKLFDSNDNYNHGNYDDYALDTCFSILDKQKNNLSALSYALLKTDIFSQFQLNKIYAVKLRIDLRYNGDLSKAKRAHDSILSVPDIQIPDSIKAKSKNYATYLYKKELFQYKNWDDYYKVYTILKNQNSGMLAEKVIVNYLVATSLFIKNAEVLLIDAESFVSYNPYKLELKKLLTTAKNSLAYNFNLSDINGNSVQLSDFKGKLVFIDFWYTGCTNCVSYFSNDLSIVEEEFKDNEDVVFISISIDKDRGKWKTSVKSGKYTSSRAINLYTNGEGANHTVIQQYNINAYPQPLLINASGKIYRTDLDLRNGNKLKRIIQEVLGRNNVISSL